MSEDAIDLIATPDAAGGTTLRAPKVGLWSDPPETGAPVDAGSSAGTLTQLNRRYHLKIPDGVVGLVMRELRPERIRAVAFGEVLFRVAEQKGVARTGAKAKGATRAAAGALQVVAPTDGVFYRAPATGATPYVAAGDRIRSGQPIGLIEVMKTFNPIAFAGAGLPEEALVVEVLAADGQEVRAGQPLVIIKPA